MSYKKITKGDYEVPSKACPGEQVKLFLELMYENNTDYIEKIDSDFMCDGELMKLTYFGTINYALRRLITSAHFIYRSNIMHGEGRVRVELRNYLSRYTRYNHSDIQKLTSYLMQCIQNSKDDFNETEKRIAINQVKEFEWGCYICGREMDTANTDPDISYRWMTADHKWPRLLGGESNPGNLRYACLDCNSKYKKDFLDYNDYHFKEISLVVTSYTHYRGSRNRSYEAAIFAKNDYKCSVCNQPAYRIGELRIGRIDVNDSWHYLNLTPYCIQHNSEK